MYILFKLLRVKQFHPLLMLFYNHEKDIKEKILESVTRLGAAVVFSYTQTNYIEKILPTMIKKYWEKKGEHEKEAVKNLIDELEMHIKNLAPTIEAILSTRNFIGKNGNVHGKALVILKFIELYFNQNTKVLSVPRGKKITVEHILSRSLDMENIDYDDLGFMGESEKRDYIHKLGNLTLLYNTDNSSVGNKIYQEKEETYKLSDFIITSTLVIPVETQVKNGQDTRLFSYINKFEKHYETPNGLWTKSLIEERSKDLAQLLSKIVLKDFD